MVFQPWMKTALIVIGIVMLIAIVFFYISLLLEQMKAEDMTERIGTNEIQP